jgi:hypothetical protein
MHGFILFLHFCGLMLGAAGGFAGGLVMLRARSAPADQAQTLRALGWPLAMMSATGLVILWATGILMLFFTAPSLPSVFWAKILFVVVLTVLIGLMHKTYADIRRTGDLALMQRLFVLGPASGATLLLVVLLAVYAFS